LFGFGGGEREEWLVVWLFVEVKKFAGEKREKGRSSGYFRV